MKNCTFKLIAFLILVFAVLNSNAQKKVAYVTSNKTLSATATATDDDAIIRLLKEDTNFEVTVFVVDSDGEVDFEGFDIAVIQESFGSTSEILLPDGSAGLASIPIPFLYNKVYAIRNERALTSGSETGGADVTGGAIIVDPSNQSNVLFNAITFVNNKFEPFKTGADDNGDAGDKYLNYVTDVSLTPTNTLLGYTDEIIDLTTTVFLNDFPAGANIGSEVIQARMIAVGMNFGAMSKDNGTNFTQNGITFWRNALYSLAEIEVPTTPYIQIVEGATKVAYVTSPRAMDPTATSANDDPVIRLLIADANFDVTVFEVEDDGTVDFTGFDMAVIQESLSSTAEILAPTGSAGLTNIPIPFIYNKMWALKDDRAITSGSPTGGGEIAGLSIAVEPSNQTNELFNAIEFTNNKFEVFREGADDSGAEGNKALNFATGITLTPTNTLLGTSDEITDLEKTIFLNDIPSGSFIGSEELKARMIAFGFNFGAICKSDGTNFTDAGITLWRNALYSIAGRDVPTTKVEAEEPGPDTSLSGIINIDFGGDGEISDPNWNNFTLEYNTVDSIVRLIDTNGNGTGFTANVYDPFSGVSSYTGTTTPDSILGLPSSATSDSYYGHTGEFLDRVAPTGGFIFGDLNKSTPYSFKIFSSRVADDNRETKFTATGLNTAVANLNASNNSSEFAVVENIYPDDEGKITLNVEPGDNNNHSLGFFYINSIRVLYDPTIAATEISGIINIDCGNETTMAEPNWNNFTLACNTPDTTLTLTDSNGNNTGISANVYDPFSGVNSSGGTDSPDASLDLPADATIDSYYGHTETFLDRIAPTGGFRFENLDVSTSYTFEIFGSRTADDNRETMYTVTGNTTATASLNASSNTSDIAIIEDIYPDAEGKITLNAEPGSNNDNSLGFFYLGAIRITFDPPTPTVNTEPELDKDVINLYPVPFNDKLSLTNVPLNSSIEVYSIMGSKVLEVQNSSGETVLLNTSKFEPGIYIIRVSDGISSFRTFKVVKS